MECIGIYFPISLTISKALQKTKVVKYSSTNRCWYSLLSKENYNKIFFAVKGLATIEHSALYKYLVEKKAGAMQGKQRSVPVKAIDAFNNVSVVSQNAKTVAFNKVSKKISLNDDHRIHDINSHILPLMEEHLKLKAYSPSTINTYIGEMAQLLKALKNIPADQLQPVHIKRYLVHCYENLRLTENTLHSRTNAIKFYYEQVLKQEKFFWEIPRPKKQVQLPRFFNQDEIAAIIKAAGNIKHKVMLMLSYAAGLRVSEVISIKVKDIDSKRMCMLIAQAKGKKDRIVTLSPVLLVLLREYWKTGKLKRDGYLFPGQYEGEPYSSRSLQIVLAIAKKRARASS